MPDRLSCRSFAANAVRLQLHALAYNLGNFLRTPGEARADQRLVADNPKREAHQDRRKVRSRGRYDGRGRRLFADIRGLVSELRRHPRSHRREALDCPTFSIPDLLASLGANRIERPSS
jgi:hypothetical protein